MLVIYFRFLGGNLFLTFFVILNPSLTLFFFLYSAWISFIEKKERKKDCWLRVRIRWCQNHTNTKGHHWCGEEAATAMVACPLADMCITLLFSTSVLDSHEARPFECHWKRKGKEKKHTLQRMLITFQFSNSSTLTQPQSTQIMEMWSVSRRRATVHRCYTASESTH